MIYVPFVITIVYFYTAVKSADLPDDSPILTDDIIHNVTINVLLTELLYFIGWWFDPFDVTPLSAKNLVLFFITQDVYFYLVHKFVFHGLLYNLHHQHHNYITSYLAWYCSPIEHLALNVGSVVVAYWLFPNARWVFVVLICLQTYTSVNGHNPNSPHSVHHRFHNKRFGSIYLLDRLMDSF